MSATASRSNHMPADARRLFYENFRRNLVQGKATCIPHDIDTGGNMFTVAPRTTSAGLLDSMNCREAHMLKIDRVVADGVLLYDAEYVARYHHENGDKDPPQNGLATHLFGDFISGNEIFGSVIVAPQKCFFP